VPLLIYICSRSAVNCKFNKPPPQTQAFTERSAIFGNILSWIKPVSTICVWLAVPFFPELLVEIGFVDVTPAPFLTALGRLNDRMMRFAEMRSRMAVFGGIAAAHVAAFQTHAQMHPRITRLEAVFAALRGWLNGFDVIFDMSACRIRHDDSPQ
jgi:hypothetical protein